MLIIEAAPPLTITLSACLCRTASAALHDNYRWRDPQLCRWLSDRCSFLPVMEVWFGYITRCTLPRATTRTRYEELMNDRIHSEADSICFDQWFLSIIPLLLFLSRWFCHFAAQRRVCPQGVTFKHRQRHDLIRGPVHRSVCCHWPCDQTVDSCHHCRTIPVRGTGWYGECLHLHTEKNKCINDMQRKMILTSLLPPSLSPSSSPPWSTSATRNPGWCFCCRTSAF